MSLELSYLQFNYRSCRIVVLAAFNLIISYLQQQNNLPCPWGFNDVKLGMYSLHLKLYVSFSFSRYIVFAIYLEKLERLTI
jgi:hypothetical protein